MMQNTGQVNNNTFGLEKRLREKVVLITGGGRGIGATCAGLFVAHGAKVAITSRHVHELNQIAQDIQKENEQAEILVHTADVSQEDDVKRLFAHIRENFGPLDILINNAAELEVCDFIELESSVWDKIIATNLRGPFLCSREAFREMKSSGKGGCIVNLSSLAGIRGTQKFKGLSAYIVSKHGIVGLTESLSVEGKPFGIRVNCVAPGAVDTAMLTKAAPFLKTKTTPPDVAKVILFLCDETQSRAITGAILEIHSNE